MIFDKLLKNIKEFGEVDFIIQDDTSYSYEQIFKITSATAFTLQEYLADLEKPRILLQLPNSVELIVLLLATNAINAKVSMISSDYNETEIEDIVNRFSYNILITNKTLKHIHDSLKIKSPTDFIPSDFETLADLEIPKDSERTEESIMVLTTGTTGLPKGAMYIWSKLVDQIIITEKLQNSRWLLAYNLNHFAGIQVLLTALFNASTLIIATEWTGDYLVELILKKKPEYISATPTFWRMILPLLKREAENFDFVKQITMGGEAITSNILDFSRKLFPNANISQIYAITEVGPIFTTKDGMIGFPYEFITNPEKHRLKARLKIVDGELYVKSEAKMSGYFSKKDTFTEDGWYPTGDLVSIEDDRVLFLGRINETINVGGVKVYPIEVEEIIQQVPGVKLVKVYGKKNPITGHLVAADVLVEEGFDSEKVREEILNNCKKYLNRYKIPRILNIKDDLDISNFKIIRREEKE